MKIDILDGIITIGVREANRPGRVIALTIWDNLQPHAEYLALTLEEADALWRELERRCTDEKVRRAEAARGEVTP